MLSNRYSSRSPSSINYFFDLFLSRPRLTSHIRTSIAANDLVQYRYGVFEATSDAVRNLDARHFRGDLPHKRSRGDGGYRDGNVGCGTRPDGHRLSAVVWDAIT